MSGVCSVLRWASSALASAARRASGNCAAAIPHINSEWDTREPSDGLARVDSRLRVLFSACSSAAAHIFLPPSVADDSGGRARVEQNYHSCRPVSFCLRRVVRALACYLLVFLLSLAPYASLANGRKFCVDRRAICSLLG